MKTVNIKHYTSAKIQQSGFTLVEIMIILAIIAILSSIALPAYKDYTEKAKVNQAASDISTIAVLAENYWNDVRAYPDNLAQIGAAGRLDPWGNPYQYKNIANGNGNGLNRKDRRLNPINSDFDLYSMGKDGQSMTQITNSLSLDDVIRASDGKFVDLASKY